MTPEVLQRQIEEYAKERSAYVTYARYLEDLLRAACRELGVQAAVTSRAKELSSFMEKAALGRKHHPDPVHDFTDLCGARVVTDTEEEKHLVYRYVEEHFEIDKANSEDKRALLGATEFSYLSVHYIVQLKPGSVDAAIMAEVGKRKAEIQIRTGLQDVWARIAHDRIYKSPFTVPEHWQREMNQLSALLEAADRDFSVILGNLEDYSTSHGAFFDRRKLEAEIHALGLIRTFETRPEIERRLALRAAALLKDLGQWKEVIETLGPLADNGDPSVLKHLGYALCYTNRSAPESAGFRKGQGFLETTVKKRETDAEAHAYLAWTLEAVGEEARARDHYEKAFLQKPRNPYYLMSYLEFQIAVRKEVAGLPLSWPALRQAAETCRQHAAAGVEIPWAYFTKAKAHLLLAEPYAALSELAGAYLKRSMRRVGFPPTYSLTKPNRSGVFPPTGKIWRVRSIWPVSCR